MAGKHLLLQFVVFYFPRDNGDKGKTVENLDLFLLGIDDIVDALFWKLMQIALQVKWQVIVSSGDTLCEQTMKLQLFETGSGWEHFEFDKDAPLDTEEEIEDGYDDERME